MFRATRFHWSRLHYAAWYSLGLADDVARGDYCSLARSVLFELHVTFFLNGADGGEKRRCLIVLSGLHSRLNLVKSIGEFVELGAVVCQKLLFVSRRDSGRFLGLKSLRGGNV